MSAARMVLKLTIGAATDTAALSMDGARGRPGDGSIAIRSRNGRTGLGADAFHSTLVVAPTSAMP